MTYLEVAQALENFINDRGGEWDWDDFILGRTFSDPYLQQLQKRMSGLTDEFPPLSKGHYCGPEGIKVIRSYIDELRAKALGRSEAV